MLEGIYFLVFLDETLELCFSFRSQWGGVRREATRRPQHTFGRLIILAGLTRLITHETEILHNSNLLRQSEK